MTGIAELIDSAVRLKSSAGMSAVENSHSIAERVGPEVTLGPGGLLLRRKSTSDAVEEVWDAGIWEDIEVGCTLPPLPIAGQRFPTESGSKSSEQIHDSIPDHSSGVDPGSEPDKQHEHHQQGRLGSQGHRGHFPSKSTRQASTEEDRPRSNSEDVRPKVSTMSSVKQAPTDSSSASIGTEAKATKAPSLQPKKQLSLLSYGTMRNNLGPFLRGRVSSGAAGAPSNDDPSGPSSNRSRISTRSLYSRLSNAVTVFSSSRRPTASSTSTKTRWNGVASFNVAASSSLAAIGRSRGSKFGGSTGTGQESLKNRQFLGDIMKETSGMAMGSRMTAGYSEKMYDLLSFADQPELLRGIRVDHVLRRQGSVLKSSRSTENSYVNSEEVEGIDAFVSHNWDTPGWQKYLCLSMYFNLSPAMFIAVLWTTLLVVLGTLGWAPTLELKSEAHRRGYLGRLFTFPIFLLMFLYCRDIIRCRFFRGPVVFLDKTCIPQNDPGLQKKCIVKLGAFLCYSNTMLICYTDLYLKRLWTTYEVASYLSLYPADRIKMLPPSVPVIFVGGSTLLWIFNVTGLFLNVLQDFMYVEFGLVPFIFLAFLVGSRNFARSRAAIARTLAAFQVDKCSCAVSTDRAMVCANIADLMKETQVLDKSSTDEEALAKFDQLVREELPTVLLKSLGKYSLRYYQMVLINFLAMMPRLCDSLPGGEGWRRNVVYAWLYVMWTTTVGPWTFVLLDKFAFSALERHAFMEILWLTLGAFCGGVYCSATFVAMAYLMDWEGDSNLGLAVRSGIAVVSSLFSAYMLSTS